MTQTFSKCQCRFSAFVSQFTQITDRAFSKNLSLLWNHGPYHNASISPLGPEAKVDASLSPKVSRCRRHWSWSHEDQSVFVIATLANLLAALQYGQSNQDFSYPRVKAVRRRAHTRRKTCLGRTLTSAKGASIYWLIRMVLGSLHFGTLPRQDSFHLRRFIQIYNGFGT